MSLVGILSGDAAAGGSARPKAEHAKVGIGKGVHLVRALPEGPEAGGGPPPQAERPRPLPLEALKGAGASAQALASPEFLLENVASQSFEIVFAESALSGKLGIGRGCVGVSIATGLELCNLDTGEVRPFSPAAASAQSFVGGAPAGPSLLAGAGAPWQGWWQKKRQQDEALWAAAESGRISAVEAALRTTTDGSAPAQVNSRSLHGRRALHLAASVGATDCAAALLRAGADVEARTDDGITALQMACQRGHLETVQLLLDSGAEAASETMDSSLAVHFAAASGHAAIVALLLDKGGDCQVLHRNSLGQRPAEVASDICTAELLRERSRVVEVADCGIAEDSYAGRTPFYEGGVLLRNSRTDAVHRLLQRTRCLPEERSPYLSASGTASPRRRCSSPTAGSDGSASRLSSPRARTTFARLRSNSAADEQVGPGAFDFVRLLGKGAFGEVFQVAHKGTRRSYAMKILRKSQVLRGNLLRYTITERNVLSYIRHPYIVSLHYAFQTARHLVLVLQFCPGGNLQCHIQHQNGLQENAARLYTAEVLLALCHLHERQIIFRDLKPENVVLDEEGHAMLTDFGLSKEGVAGLRSAQSFCGSLAFLAPEVLQRRGHGRAVDLYGLGVLLFNMFTAMPPFFHPEQEALLKNIRCARLRVPKYVPKAAAMLIQALMERDPSDRLGAGATCEVKEHIWFATIDWEALMERRVPAPSIPSPLPTPPVARTGQKLPESLQRTPCVVEGGGWWRGLGLRQGGDEDGAGKMCAARSVSGWDFASAAPRRTPRKAKTGTF
mmetsp:Transcript_133762/g.286051  ORF Transcript_133762/g.286051 Transcript_133762/m.286051 type:complete len:786 (+) Transcript_133762:125-2482(+)